MSRRIGFTLIELLVVVSIIALLIAILLPALGAARESSKEIQCAIDQRTLGTASYVWAGDHKNWLADFDKLPDGSAITNYSKGIGTRQLYFVDQRWHDALREYGVIRSNWYSVSNERWNDDAFWDFSGSYANSSVIGRVALAGDRGNNFANDKMTSAADSGFAGSETLPAFPSRTDDESVLGITWTDLNREKGGVFTNNADWKRQGANHAHKDDVRKAKGTHITKVDGSTTFEPWEAMRERGNNWNQDFWW